MRAELAVVAQRAQRDELAGKVLLRQNVAAADHGSILLDAERKLAGVMIRHPQQNRRNEHTFFISAEHVRGFLRDNKVMFSRGGRQGAAALTENSLSRTVARVYCSG